MAQFPTFIQIRSTFLLMNLLLHCLILQLQRPSHVAAKIVDVDLLVIGDSTAANYTHAATYPLSGWAMFLPDHFSHNAVDVQLLVQVRDLAVPGRSSKSFYDEKHWEQAKLTYLSAGDYVFIQFGHNDGRTDAQHHTDPFTTYKHYLTLYINETRAAMAHPVLLTSISRAVWQDGTVNQLSVGHYPAAMRQLAQELRVPLIDLNEDTAALFNKLGENVTQSSLFMCLPAGEYPNYPNGIHDTTHLQEKGAKLVATLAAQGIVKANLPIQVSLLNSDRLKTKISRRLL